ncbi:ankyrin repeat domain-containing protein 66 isoform X1 [Misgurnus anguillicaudatus]|uniref:ankyrin repeat domain-containing protein 66 isoform X1 n=2 Tax=Misgurnus anguillicaudatus TaxID=75329 RepID=UPI003CCF7405
MTELHQAAAVGDVDLVEEIIKKKSCDPNHKDTDWNQKTALHWAASKGQTEVVRILMENGARACLRTDDGWTPAHFAAESGRLAVLRLLHSLHAPIDKEDSSGDKPVRIAEIYGHEDCVHFLKKAEVESRNYHQMAKLNGLTIDDTDDEWQQEREANNAEKTSQTEVVRILMENGARACLRTDDGWTPAHFAAESGRLAVLRLLHSLHAPIDKEDSSGDKPVRIAEIYGHEDCVHFLKKAEVESRNYHQMAKLNGLTIDDTDEEWQQEREANNAEKTSNKADFIISR